MLLRVTPLSNAVFAFRRADAELRESRHRPDPEARADAEAWWREAYFRLYRLLKPGVPVEVNGLVYTRNEAWLAVEPASIPLRRQA